MSDETRFSGHSWDALMDETRSGFQGPIFEGMRRVVVALEDQTRASDAQARASAALTRWIMVLTVVGVVLMALQAWAAFEGLP